MTPEAFVALGAGLAMVKAKVVMGAVRLALGHRTFATIGWPEVGWAVVKLAPRDQQGLVKASPAITAEPGPRGKKGVTLVHLDGINEALASRVLQAAWRNAGAAETPMAKAG